MSKSGNIDKKEIEYYLSHWGFKLTKTQFQELYSLLDRDGDGLISYEDFQHSVGNEISPPEFLYFRQENQKTKFAKCLFPRCWDPAEGQTDYCALHAKVNKQNAIETVAMIKNQIS